VFPEERSNRRPDVKRITKQLAPRSRISPLKAKIFDKGKGKAMSSLQKLQMTDADLRKLGIDPSVFNALPKSLQSEQLIRARLIQKLGKVPEVSGTPVKIPAPDRRTKGPVFRLPPPQSCYLPAAILRQQGPQKGQKIPLTETHDIQRAIKKWVKTYRRWPPHAKDVEFFAKFLRQSVDGTISSDVGVERAVAILKWWLVLLRRYWGSYEIPDVFDIPSQSTTREVADAWWAAFRQVKEDVDVVARKKFGGRLSLR
jgi:DNA repair protein REV1